ncbi:MAG: radical SAM protein, partial [Candidatus Shapirobacteria bacterium]|nr:radical SAM protein [Candidatus Shapirobacteria bacterium]
LKKIDGLIFKENKKIIKTSPRKLIKNIDELPFPAREITPMEDIYLKNQFNLFGVKRQISIMTSRGCPYHCVFCGSPVQWGTVRFHSPEYVIKEIKFLVKNYNIDSIMFWDDLFIAPIERLEKLKDLIIKNKLNKKLVFFGYARANLITEDVCKVLAKMNTKRLIFGLESGSPRILNYLKQNSVTVEDNKRAVDLCRKYGITSSSGYIVGTPGETIKDLQCTYDLMKKHPLDNTQIYILTPYPGTKIWIEAKKKKLVSENMDFDKLFVQLPPISFFDFFKTQKNLINKRIFLNTKYRNNKDYMKLVLKIQKLAYIQNIIFYIKIIPQNLDLIKRLIFNKIKCL